MGRADESITSLRLVYLRAKSIEDRLLWTNWIQCAMSTVAASIQQQRPSVTTNNARNMQFSETIPPQVDKSVNPNSNAPLRGSAGDISTNISPSNLQLQLKILPMRFKINAS